MNWRRFQMVDKEENLYMWNGRTAKKRTKATNRADHLVMIENYSDINMASHAIVEISCFSKSLRRCRADVLWQAWMLFMIRHSERFATWPELNETLQCSSDDCMACTQNKSFHWSLDFSYYSATCGTSYGEIVCKKLEGKVVILHLVWHNQNQTTKTNQLEKHSLSGPYLELSSISIE